MAATITSNRGGMDRVATVSSAVCAVHCAVSPMLLPLLPVALGHYVGPGLEVGFVVAAILLGVVSLGHSYRALHRNRRPLSAFVIGITMLMASKMLGEATRWLELPAVVVGASCVMMAHLMNLRMSRSASAPGACPCPCHDTSST